MSANRYEPSVAAHRVEYGGEDHEARMDRIRRRVAARGGQRGFVRCLLPRRPASRAEEIAICGPRIQCGAIVFAGDERDHEDDVHGGVVGSWMPVLGSVSW